ncbi:MAG: SigE family RNA polymerase sigma factor [Solirubrobacteraceae bacterium]
MRRPYGRRSGFEEFAAEHAEGLVRLAYVMCGDRSRAEDACQETLVALYRRWPRLETPLAYARRSVINASRDGWRRDSRQHRTQETLTELARTESEHPEDALLARAALMDALRRLPDRQRAVIVLRYGSQLTETETAATLDISIGTVKSQTARAFARLRAELSSEQIIYDMEER